MLVEAGKSKMSRGVWKARDAEKSKCYSVSLKVVYWQNSFLLGGRPISVLLKPSTDLMRPTHIMEDNPLNSRSPNLKFNLIIKTPL